MHKSEGPLEILIAGTLGVALYKSNSLEINNYVKYAVDVLGTVGLIYLVAEGVKDIRDYRDLYKGIHKQLDINRQENSDQSRI